MMMPLVKSEFRDAYAFDEAQRQWHANHIIEFKKIYDAEVKFASWFLDDFPYNFKFLIGVEYDGGDDQLSFTFECIRKILSDVL